MDGTEERVPVGAYRSTSKAAKVKLERNALERDSGPRPEEKGKKKVANVTREFVGAVGNLNTSRRNASRRVGTGV